MARIDIGEPTSAEGVADRLDTFRLAWQEMTRATGSQPEFRDVIELAHFLDGE